ncbi:unnamed protein product [Nyctereutes procyonoides]|uniref:(raccoon dog) hypothetical protein n=1 Tax=Nyctereutes procyonoides TaxID=34880 RepID=A0A811ZPP2_NYCPR|nr:unnamed protein product [Nyctereutes procyonoides]
MLYTGSAMDYHEEKRKKRGQEAHDHSKKAKEIIGLKAKNTKQKNDRKTPQGAVPAYLLDRKKAGKWEVPLPEVHAQGETEVLKHGRGWFPKLKATFCLPILIVEKDPSSPLYTMSGVITKCTVLVVDVSEVGLVTNNPENDGGLDAVLLV